MNKLLLTIALGLTTLVVNAADTFYWYGSWNNSKTWGDYSDPKNWSLSKDSYSNPDARIPSASDYLWSGGWSQGGIYRIGYFDLGGESRTVAAWSPGTAMDNWKNYCVELTNGTLTVKNPTYMGSGVQCSAGRLFTIWNGATLIYPKATSSYAFFASSLDEQWKIKKGGRVEVYCSAIVEGSSEQKDTANRGPTYFSVDDGGVLIFDPVDFSTSTVNRYGVDFVNNGVMEFPHGLTWSKPGTTAVNSFGTTDRVGVKQNSGRMLIGGDFVKTDKNTAIPGNLNFVLAGGTLEITNSVRFYTAETAYDLTKGWTDQVFASMPADASATVDVKTDSSLDLRNFTFGDNTSLTKVGPGTILVGANRPSELEVAEGAISFDGAIQLANITFSGNGAILAQPGMTIGAAVVASGAKVTFDAAMVADGETIVAAESDADAAVLATRIVMPTACAGFTVVTDGKKVVLKATAAVAPQTYYWKGNLDNWGDFRNLNNWAWTNDGSVKPNRLPCLVDNLYIFGKDSASHGKQLGMFNLGGSEISFATYGVLPDGTRGYCYQLSVTNGTLKMTALDRSAALVSLGYTVYDGGCIILDGTAKHISGCSGTMETWTINAGGRMEIVHGSSDANRMTPATSNVKDFNMFRVNATVQAGGTLVFDPERFCMNNSSKNNPVSFTNYGTFIAPHGIIWNGYDPWVDNGYCKTFIVNQNAGTMYLGGNFTKVIAEATANHPARMQFVFAGGKLVTSNSVAFCNTVLSQGKYEVEATMTGSGIVETAEDSTLDLGIMTFAEGVTLTKQGAGTMILRERPANVLVNEGVIRFMEATSDYSGITFTDGATICFSKTGNNVSGIPNATKLNYEIGAGFVTGDEIIIAANASDAATIAANVTLPDYLEGCVAKAEGNKVVIEGALMVKPRNVTIYVGDEPINHGFVVMGFGPEVSVWDLVKGTPVYTFGGYTTSSAAGTYEISVSGLTNVDDSKINMGTAVLTVLDPSVQEVFYWQGGSAWADFGDIANWSMSSDGSVPATRLPGRRDSIWGLSRTSVGNFGTVGNFNLCEQDYTIYGVNQSNRIADWKEYTAYVTNGTLRITSMTSAKATTVGTGFIACNGARIEVQSSGNYYTGVSGVDGERWTARTGGYISMVGGDYNVFNTAFTVEQGATFIFAPDTMCLNNSSHNNIPFLIDNYGTFIAPNGLIWNGVDPYSNVGVTKKLRVYQRAGATMYLGNNFTKTVPENTANQPASMLFTFEGGTLVVSNSVSFCNSILSQGEFEVEATMTGDGVIQVADDAKLDLGIMTYANGVTLRKRGMGLLKLGANRPENVIVEEGALSVNTPITSVNGLTFVDGSTLVFGSCDNNFEPPTNFAKINFVLDTASFGAGSKVLESDNAEFRSHVAASIAGSLPSDTRATISGNAVILAPMSSYIFEADGRFELSDSSKWSSLTVPNNEDVVIFGASTEALIDHATPTFKSIQVTGGATLRVNRGTVDLPMISLVYPSKLVIGEGATAKTIGGLECFGDANGLPIIKVETNGVLRVMPNTVFKNVDITNCGTIGNIPAENGAMRITFGGASANETTYFALTSIGGTFEFTGVNDGTSLSAASRRFVAPDTDGAVVVTRPILLKDTVFNGINSKGSVLYLGTVVGYGNPNSLPFDFILDNTVLDVARIFAFASSVNVRLINGAKTTHRTQHPGVVTTFCLWNSAKIELSGEGSQMLLANSDPYRHEFLPDVNGSEFLRVCDGAMFAAHNTYGYGRGVAVFEDGVLGVPNLPFLSTDLNPHPVNNDVRNWMSSLLEGFKEIKVTAGKKMHVRSADVMGETYGYLGLKGWDRDVKFANIPITGEGDVIIENGASDYGMAATVVSSANTCSGNISAGANASLRFADGANWAGTVIGNAGLAITNLTDAASPATVTFNHLELNGTMPIRVWRSGASDNINLGSAISGTGKIQPVFMDGKPNTGTVTFVIGRYPASAGVPAANYARNNCEFSVEPIEGTSEVLLKMTYRPRGLSIIFR